MEYTITKNPAFNSLEITFPGKPSEAVRDALKGLRFRWHHVKGIWYGYADEDALKAALSAADSSPVQNPAPSAVKAEAKPAQKTAQAPQSTPQDHVRIYWNGIKIDGGKLIRCGYSLDNNAEHAPSVSIYAHDYADLPRDLLPVHNETDIYTDYIDNDHAFLTPDHPLYKYFRFAAMKAQARDDVKYCENLRERLNSGRREPWPGHFDGLRADLARREAFLAEFAAAADPGQPTAEDLAAIDRRRQETENARREAERDAELKEREALLIMKNDGRRMIENTAATFPIQEGAPVVTIDWSEHPAFYHWEDGALKLSINAADQILRTLDMEAHNDPDHGYYKTAFRITGTDPDGDPINYTGRYDLGDNDGGLIQHIRSFGEWHRTHDEFGHEILEPATSNDIIEFADYLAQFIS